MTLTAVLGILATCAGCLLGLAPTGQIRLVLARRSSEGISIVYWWVLLADMALWLAYGLSAGDLALIVSCSVSVATGLVMVAILVRYRVRGAVPSSVPQVDALLVDAGARP